jgi:hypothetical protein
MDKIEYAIAAYLLATVVAHFPIYWISTRLTDALGRESQDSGVYLPAILGMIERALFITAILLDHIEFIAVWLALKAAAQWSGWQNVPSGV